MGVTADMASLFAGNPQGAALDSHYRVGVLIQFSQDDGSNIVAIGTSEIPNLPFLLTGAEIGFSEGDNVLVMYLGNTPMIIGKIASVGSPAFGSHSLSSTQTSDFAQGWALPSSDVDLVSCSLTAPQWANTATLIGGFWFTARNTRGASPGGDDDVLININLNGDFPGEQVGYGHGNSNVGMVATHSSRQRVNGGDTLQCSGRGSATGGYTANSGNTAVIVVTAIWTKE